MAHATPDVSGIAFEMMPAANAIDEAGADVPYDHAIQKSVHNAYSRAEPLLDQLIYHRVRSLELDIHTMREGNAAPPRDWFVYHEDNPLMRSTSCSQLSDCLGQLAAFHRAVPRHEVVTLFVDLKDRFEEGHRPSDLDLALTRALGRENIVAPEDLVGACAGATSVRDAVTGTCAFPSLRALRGKFLIVTTGGSSCDPGSLVSSYGGDDPRQRLAFVGPAASGACTVASYDARPDVVFFNMPASERSRAREVRARGLVARIYGGGVAGGLNDSVDFLAARLAGGIHLATDKANIHEDAWTVTHGRRGFPFACDGCSDELVEPGAVLGLRATSEDQWAGADSGFLAYETDPGDATWSALVSVPSSHTEPFAKACLVARSSDDPNAASVAVCRAFDAHPPRAQIRAAVSAATTATDAPSFDGITAESPAFLRLAVRNADGGSEVTAAASADGKTWTTVSKARLAMPLPVRGVSVSSHGCVEARALFTNLSKSAGGSMTRMTTASLARRPLGAGARGDAFDGVFGP